MGLHGDPCSTDFDCDPKAFCWYKYEADVEKDFKRCLTKYSQDTGTTFGWKPIGLDELENAVHHGKFCKSGWAWNSNNENKAQCSQVTSIVTDKGTEMKSPFNCTATLPNNNCLYYLDNSNNNYLKGLCECALDDHDGFCPYPG